MSPFQIWLEENFVLVLSVAFGLSVLFVVLGGLSVWRTGRQLARPPRPLVRFGLSLVLLVVGVGGTLRFLDGLNTVVPATKAQKRMLGEPAPALGFALVTEEGEGRLADYRDRVVLVNVWATWCPPCREEMPALDKLHRTYSEEGLVVLQISDERPEKVAGYLAENPMSTVHGIARPIPWPEFGRPTSFVVDRDGVVRKIITGARDYEGFERLVRAYL